MNQVFSESNLVKKVAYWWDPFDVNSRLYEMPRNKEKRIECINNQALFLTFLNSEKKENGVNE
jgi:hypothetical protein